MSEKQKDSNDNDYKKPLKPPSMPPPSTPPPSMPIHATTINTT